MRGHPLGAQRPARVAARRRTLAMLPPRHQRIVGAGDGVVTPPLSPHVLDVARGQPINVQMGVILQIICTGAAALHAARDGACGRHASSHRQGRSSHSSCVGCDVASPLLGACGLSAVSCACRCLKAADFGTTPCCHHGRAWRRGGGRGAHCACQAGACAVRGQSTGSLHFASGCM